MQSEYADYVILRNSSSEQNDASLLKTASAPTATVSKCIWKRHLIHKNIVIYWNNIFSDILYPDSLIEDMENWDIKLFSSTYKKKFPEIMLLHSFQNIMISWLSLWFFLPSTSALSRRKCLFLSLSLIYLAILLYKRHIYCIITLKARWT